MIECLIVAVLTQTPDEAAAIDEAASPTIVDVNPGVWLTRVRGNTTFGGAALKLDEVMGVDDLNAAFRGEMTIRNDDWAVKIKGVTLSTSGRAEVSGGSWGGRTITAGDATSFDMTWLQLEGHWRAWTPMGDGRFETNEAMDLSFGPHIAASYIDLEESLTSGGVPVRASGAWWSVLAGLQMNMAADLRQLVPWLHQLRVGISGQAGTTVGQGSFAWSVEGGLTLMVTPNVGAIVGYRLMEFNELKSGDWEVSPRFPGLFIGANVSF
ncbi:MAG: hypothetical protein MK101_11255 [Phycisphaerales bacterium]|nr:hypothetical protein [Phycisphaerales bacterium]